MKLPYFPSIVEPDSAAQSYRTEPSLEIESRHAKDTVG